MNKIDKRIEARIKLRRENEKVLLAYFSDMSEDVQLDLLAIARAYAARYKYNLALAEFNKRTAPPTFDDLD